MTVTSSQSPHLPVLNNAFSVRVADRQPAEITQENAAIRLPGRALGHNLSRWCLVASIAATGVKTQLKELAPEGVADPADVGESLFLVALVLACSASRCSRWQRCTRRFYPSAAPRQVVELFCQSHERQARGKRLREKD
jgi:hypothetical protein